MYVWTSILYSEHLRFVILIDTINWKMDNANPITGPLSRYLKFAIFSRRVMVNNFQ